jgi:hypothetical protein
MHIDFDSGLGMHPAILDPAARKDEPMNAIRIGNGQMHPPSRGH